MIGISVGHMAIIFRVDVASKVEEDECKKEETHHDDKASKQGSSVNFSTVPICARIQ